MKKKKGTKSNLNRNESESNQHIISKYNPENFLFLSENNTKKQNVNISM